MGERCGHPDCVRCNEPTSPDDPRVWDTSEPNIDCGDPSLSQADLERALKRAAGALQDASEAFDEQGDQVAASDMHEAHEDLVAAAAALPAPEGDVPDDCRFGMCPPDCEHEPVPAGGEDGRMFTFTTSSEPPEARVVCKNCGDGAAGDRPRDVFPWADTHFCGPADGPEDRGFWKPEQI